MVRYTIDGLTDEMSERYDFSPEKAFCRDLRLSGHAAADDHKKRLKGASNCGMEEEE